MYIQWRERSAEDCHAILTALGVHPEAAVYLTYTYGPRIHFVADVIYGWLQDRCKTETFVTYLEVLCAGLRDQGNLSSATLAGVIEVAELMQVELPPYLRPRDFAVMAAAISRFIQPDIPLKKRSGATTKAY